MNWVYKKISNVFEFPFCVVAQKIAISKLNLRFKYISDSENVKKISSNFGKRPEFEAIRKQTPYLCWITIMSFVEKMFVHASFKLFISSLSITAKIIHWKDFSSLHFFFISSKCCRPLSLAPQSIYIEVRGIIDSLLWGVIKIARA